MRKGRRELPLPEFPELLIWLWQQFGRLSKRRHDGGPLTYSEIEAYERKALITFTAWEADLLMRLDDTVLAVWSGKGGADKPATVEGATDQIPVSDVRSLKEMVRARAAVTKAIKETRAPAAKPKR